MKTSTAYGMIALGMSLIILAFVGLIVYYVHATVIQEPVSQPQSQQTSYDVDYCTLPYVSCDGQTTIQATVTTYQAVRGQTDSDPCTTASGMNACTPPYPIVAANGYPFGTKVVIRGVTYTVADRMAKRYGKNHFDILTKGSNFSLVNEPVTLL